MRYFLRNRINSNCMFFLSMYRYIFIILTMRVCSMRLHWYGQHVCTPALGGLFVGVCARVCIRPLGARPRTATHDHKQPRTTMNDHERPCTTINGRAQPWKTTRLRTTMNDHAPPRTTTHDHKRPRTTTNYHERPRTTTNAYRLRFCSAHDEWFILRLLQICHVQYCQQCVNF